MYIVKKHIIFICIFILVLIITSLLSSVLAITESERQELIDLLNEYKEDLGNLNQFKQVVDKTYNDLSSATTVDNILKETLKADIDALDTVTDLNPLILTVLKVELNSQVNNLTSNNLSEMQDEISLIKEWTDEQVDQLDTNINDTDINNNTNNNFNSDVSKLNQNNDLNPTTQQSTQNTYPVINTLPYTGTSRIIMGCIILLCISTTVSIIRYKQFKDIK